MSNDTVVSRGGASTGFGPFDGASADRRAASCTTRRFALPSPIAEGRDLRP